MEHTEKKKEEEEKRKRNEKRKKGCDILISRNEIDKRNILKEIVEGYPNV